MFIPMSELTKLGKEGLSTIQIINRIEIKPPKTPEERAVKVLLEALKSERKDYEVPILKFVA